MAIPSWQSALERQFERQGEFITQRPKITLMLAILFIGLCVHQLPNIRADGSIEGFLSADHPAVQSIAQNREIFGRTDLVVVAVQSSELFTRKNLSRLLALQQALATEVPNIERVDGILNARLTRGEDDALLVEEFLHPLPTTDEEIALKKRIATNHPLYKNLVMSADGTLTTLRVKSGPVPEKQDVDEALVDMIAGLESVVQKHQADDFQILLAGTPTVSQNLINTMRGEMPKFMRATLLGCAIFLLVMFRRASGVLLPLVTLIFSVLSTIGVMALFDQPLQMPTMILPSFLLAVGVGDSVHFLAYFYRKFDESKDKHQAIVYALHHTGLPMLLTSLTTAAGLLSFAGAPILPVANLGRFSAFGVMVAFGFTVVLIPALICLLPLKSHNRTQEDYDQGPMSNTLNAIGQFSIRRASVLTALTVIILSSAIFFASQVGFSHNPLMWFPKDSPVRVATETVDQTMGGSVSIDVIVDSEKPGGLKNPKLLRALDQAMQKLATYQDGAVRVAKVTGLPILLKEIHQALNDNDPNFYQVPDTQPLIAQELLLFENSDSDDLETMVDFNYQKARIVLMIPWIDAVLYDSFIAQVESTFRDEIGPLATVELSGVLPLFAQTLHAVILTTATSYAIALGVIGIMMILLLGSIRYGLLSMIPNLLPILVVMAWMHLGDIPLDLFTMLIASIAIGITVDDTIHFMYNFVRDYREHGNVDQAIHRTLQGAGRAMLITTIVLSIGFLTFTLSEVNNLLNFGKLTAAAIGLALVADFIVAPALLKVTHPNGPK